MEDELDYVSPLPSMISPAGYLESLIQLYINIYNCNCQYMIKDSIKVICFRGPSRGGLVLCAMCKIHLLAMCYVSFCSHCYVKLK